MLHFVAFGYVGESAANPAKYYDNKVARWPGCNALVFSSTCAVYGLPAQVPIDEDTRPDPINPYGASNLMVERSLADFRPTYGPRSMALRHFNVWGADQDTRLTRFAIRRPTSSRVR